MHVALGLVALVAVVAVVSVLARRLGTSAPLLLTVVGVVGSYLPFVPDVVLSSELVLVGLLPPLLYAAAIRTSLVDFRANRRAIGLLSVGLVVFTTVGVGLVTWLLLPVPLAAGLALGAVVAPPDAVAATAVARRVGMPRRIVTILEGESLVNDATAIVCLRTAVAALAGSVTVLEVAGDFVLAAGGGVVLGVVVAAVGGGLRKRVTDPVLDTTLSLTAPFVAYIAAETVHASGVLAVVVTGLLLGHKSPVLQTAASRISERTNWATVQFLLENAVFLLIGLQVRGILSGVGESELPAGQIAAACLGVLLTVVLLRPLWVFPATYLPRFLPAVRRGDPAPPWQYPAVVAWAGMRGVVTLAAVFVIPEGLRHREVLVLVALVVVAGTLLLQGSTLPWLVRRLGLRGPDPAEDALQEAVVLQSATEAGVAELRRIVDEDAGAGRAPPDGVVDLLRERGLERVNTHWERLGRAEDDVATPSQTYRRLRLAMLAAERSELLRLRDTGTVADEVLQQVMTTLDVEESMLDRAVERAQLSAGDDVLAPELPGGGCEHLEAAPRSVHPKTPEGCEDCLAEGLEWVHLRMCLECGRVGCCDSSVGRHAQHHFDRAGHPVMRSVEPGEAWRWCYPHALAG